MVERRRHAADAHIHQLDVFANEERPDAAAGPSPRCPKDIVDGIRDLHRRLEHAADPIAAEVVARMCPVWAKLFVVSVTITIADQTKDVTT